jgi:hypothetical protein
MNSLKRELEMFRNAGSNGDDQAVVQCEARFGNGLRRVIRRTLSRRQTANDLTSFILEEARRVREETGLERDDLVSEIAERLVGMLSGQGIQGRIETLQASLDATITTAA